MHNDTARWRHIVKIFEPMTKNLKPETWDLVLGKSSILVALVHRNIGYRDWEKGSGILDREDKIQELIFDTQE